MKIKNEGEYVAPEINVLEIRIQGVIAASNVDPGNPFGGNTESNPWG